MAEQGGSKTIGRIGAILRMLERGPEEGLSSAKIAEGTGFEKATAYRALISLERAGLVDRDVQTRRFRLGIYLFALGSVVARRFSVLSHARQTAAKIAQETGDTVYLSVRNKYDSVCIDCLNGSYPIKAQTLTVGESVPLGVSTAGVAMLATMADEEVRHAVQYNAVAITRFRTVRPDEIYAHVAQTRERGYSLYYGQVVAGMGGVGRAIRDARGEGVAVISVTAVLDRLSDDRIRFIAGLLEQGVGAIEDRLRLVGHSLG